MTKVNNKSRLAMRWGGAAGDGLQSTGLLLQKYFNKLGYHVQGFPGTQSTIRGGHVWQHVEIAAQRIETFDRPLDLLICLNRQTLEVHGRDMKTGGVVIFNGDQLPQDYLNFVGGNVEVLAMPLTAMAREVDLQTPVLANTVAVGIVLKLLGLDTNRYVEVLQKRFGARQKIIDMNIEALMKGYAMVSDQRFTLDARESNNNRIVISGNEMIALGAAASGLKFLAQYPITPASSILTYLSNRAKKLGIVVRQAEDELAAINMVIGAAYAGARAMTASSGPGLSLMAESFGYASMTETPIVVVNAMRGGPSTGIPTKMEQSDLMSMIYLSHGEAPRIILAPRNIKEAFDLTVRAFNLADIYQIPVIILSDFSLSERTENLEPFDMDVEIDRGKIWNGQAEDYRRYEITNDGVSPRVLPGTKGGEYILVGAEHDEASHSLSGNRCGLPSSWEVRDRMIAKRYRKFELIRKNMEGPKLIGDKNAETTLLCWGSIEGAVQETMDRLRKEGMSVNMLSFAELYPLPVEKIKPALEKINKAVMIEVNYTGQFEELLYQHLGWRADHRIHPLSGETPTPSSLYQAVKALSLEVVA